jgi:hypothetical protein
LNSIVSGLSLGYFKFAPNSAWDQTSSNFYFENLGFLNTKMKSFYGIFESDGSSTNDILFKVINKMNQDSFQITLNADEVTYSINLDGVDSIIATETITIDEKFSVGIDLSKISLLSYENIFKFFENLSLLSMYIAGDESGYFNGKIYKVGFDGEYNNKKIQSSINSSGIFNLNSASTLINHTANYTLVPILKYGLFFADVAVSGYWQDYMPLTYFAKYVKNNTNDLVYDLDFLQFNVDYPEPLETFTTSVTGTSSYSELNSKFATPYQKTYAYLDNSAFTGWSDYESLRLFLVEKYYYNTEKSVIKTSISFQKIKDGANKTLLDFSNVVQSEISSIVDPNNSTYDWEDSAFTVVDGSIIYPPLKNIESRAVDFNDMGIVYHLEFNVNGIYHNKIALKQLQIASQVLNAVDFTPIGTKYGIDVYPYSKTGLYYNFKEKNPISTYKGSTPYLYLTRHSGWRIRGTFDEFIDRGISIPINKEKNKDIKVNSIQTWIKYTEKTFPTGEIKIMSLVSKNNTYDFYFDADTTLERAKIYAKNRESGIIQNQFKYYVNGQFTNNPYIIREEWASLSIAFGSLLDFTEFSGRLNLNGPLIYNNVSYYLSSNLEQEQRVQTRTWAEVLGTSTGINPWSYWESPVGVGDILWNDVKIISVSEFALVDPSVGYSKYIGNDRIIIDDGVGGLLINPEHVINSNTYDDVRLYGTTEWLNSTRIAV